MAGQPAHPVRAFCEVQGVAEASFYWCRREIQRRDRARPRFLPVKVVDEVEPSGEDVSAIRACRGLTALNRGISNPFLDRPNMIGESRHHGWTATASSS